MKSKRIDILTRKMMKDKRSISIEQARITTAVYWQYNDLSVNKKRALALKAALEQLAISVEPEELIVGNRVKGSKCGAVFPEGGSLWVTELTDDQNSFSIKKQDLEEFQKQIYPYWKTGSFEEEFAHQPDDPPLHILAGSHFRQSPDITRWLEYGPHGLLNEAIEKIRTADKVHKVFYECVIVTLDGAIHFMQRYHDYIEKMLEDVQEEYRSSLKQVGDICYALSIRPPETFQEALQSLWFLCVILQIETNASVFSLGHIDQYLYPYYCHDIDQGLLTPDDARELLECFFLKMNQALCVNLDTSYHPYPVDFNMMLGGINTREQDDALTELFIAAEITLGLPEPKLSLCLDDKTSDRIYQDAVDLIAKGTNNLTFYNDKVIIPELEKRGIASADACQYGTLGTVITAQGHTAGASLYAELDLYQALLLTMAHGLELRSNKRLCDDYGGIDIFKDIDDLKAAYKKTLLFFKDKALKDIEKMNGLYQKYLPDAFLSCFIHDCLKKGADVTAGGARYHLTGIDLTHDRQAVSLLTFIRGHISDGERSVEDIIKRFNETELIVDQDDQITRDWLPYFDQVFEERDETYYMMGDTRHEITLSSSADLHISFDNTLLVVHITRDFIDEEMNRQLLIDFFKMLGDTKLKAAKIDLVHYTDD